MKFQSDFFPAITSFLRGSLDAPGLEEKLGKSASGQHRLNYYRTLMLRNRHLILGSLFSALRRFLEDSRPGSFRELLEEYDAAHPPNHYEPNQFGRHLPSFVEARVAEGGLPAGAEEIADFEWLHYSTAVAHTQIEPFAEAERPLLPLAEPVPYAVRRYAHQVKPYCFSVWSGAPKATPTSGSEAAPKQEKSSDGAGATSRMVTTALHPEPSTVLFYQSRKTGRTLTRDLSLAEALALAQSEGLLEEAHRRMVSEEALERATEALEELGVLAKSHQ